MTARFGTRSGKRGELCGRCDKLLQCRVRRKQIEAVAVPGSVCQRSRDAPVSLGKADDILSTDSGDVQAWIGFKRLLGLS